MAKETWLRMRRTMMMYYKRKAYRFHIQALLAQSRQIWHWSTSANSEQIFGKSICPFFWILILNSVYAKSEEHIHNKRWKLNTNPEANFNRPHKLMTKNAVNLASLRFLMFRVHSLFRFWDSAFWSSHFSVRPYKLSSALVDYTTVSLVRKFAINNAQLGFRI